jgi:hypothetical protein
MRGIATSIVILGMGLLAASWFWPDISGHNQTWSEQQAQSFLQARSDLHRLTYESAQSQDMSKPETTRGNPQSPLAELQLSKAAQTGASVDPASASADRITSELASAKERYQRERTALDEARAHGQGAATVMRWLGLGLAAAGLFGLLAVRSHSAA